ncbi:hypothetical protein BH11PSE12_BH11PSE12_27640 [soil metagenome]
MRTQKHRLHHPPLHKKSHQHFRLERWHRWSLFTVMAGLSVSGLVWLIAHFFLRQTSEFGAVVHPWEHPALQLHGALAMAALLLVGALLQLHMRRAHRAGCNRGSGWSMVALLAGLLLSGYGLYYLASEESRVIWSGLHWVAGLGLPGLLWLHILMGRKLTTHR